MIKEYSAGAVLFYLSEKREFLLLHYNEGHWDFPKGHIEGDETEEETCIREVIEETGITGIDIMKGFSHSYSYFYRRGKETFNKTVVFFVAKVPHKNVKISHEHQNFVWLPYDAARKKLTFQNAKDLLKLANDFVEKKTLGSFV